MKLLEMDVAYKGLMTELTDWLNSAGEMVPKLVLAALILVLFWVAGRLTASGARRALQRSRVNQAAAGLISTILRISVVMGGFMIALGVLQLDKALTSVLAGAGVVGLALGFAFQDLAANLISGVGLAMNRNKPFRIGDLVETNGEFGKVSRVDLRTCTIEALDGRRIEIPNKKIYQDTVVNHSVAGRRRVDVECGISYAERLPHVAEVVARAIGALPFVREPEADKEKVEVLMTGFGDSSINFVARFWVDFESQASFLQAKSHALMAIKQAFDDEDIQIPFPIRTLDFGIRGGKQLHTEIERVFPKEAAE